MSSLIDRAQKRSSDRRRVQDPDETRALLALAFRPAGATIVLLSALVVVTLVVANSDLTGTFGAIATSWLGIHQVPSTISGTSLGVLPLVPTMLMVWAVARGAGGAVTVASARREVLRVVGAAVAGPLVVTAVALAVISDASAVIPLASPSALSAFGWVSAVHLIAASVGVAVTMWPGLDEEIPVWVRFAVRPGIRAVMALFAAGAVATTLSLLLAWSTVGSLLERGDGVVGMSGLTILSMLYLPNVVVGATAALTGATADFGDVSISVFGTVGGALPPLPVLAAVPDGHAGAGWPALLVIPAVIGVLLGRDCGRRVTGQDALFTVVVAAAGAGVVMAMAGLVAGGDLGTFGTVEVSWWAFGLLTFAWLALLGTVTAVVIAWVRSRREPDETPSGADDGDDDLTLTPDEVPAIETHHDSRADVEVIDAEVVDEGGPAALHGGADVDVVDAEVEEDSVELEEDTADIAESDLPKGSTTPTD